MKENAFYCIGKVDASAEILMLVRLKGERIAIRELAEQLIAAIPGHPHASWILENLPAVEKKV